jgi:L-cysteine S-thiosulfotransferase
MTRCAGARAQPLARALVLPAVLVTALSSAGSACAQHPDTRRSGFDFMSPRIQAMQKDDVQNPGMLWVGDGQTIWNSIFGPSHSSCATCHGDGSKTMRGVAARYPSWDEQDKRVVTLAQRINLCRTRNQFVWALPPESQELLSLEAFVAHQSRGMALAPPADRGTAQSRQRGKVIFESRIGQLNLSCAQCHDALAGRSLAGNSIPQAHPTGYPAYRFEWQGMGSLQRRLRNCLSGVRAEPFPFNAQELTDLEAYLAGRAAGMLVETPAVRP